MGTSIEVSRFRDNYTPIKVNLGTTTTLWFTTEEASVLAHKLLDALAHPTTN